MPRLVSIISILILLGFENSFAQQDSLALETKPSPDEVDTTAMNRGFALELSADYGKVIETLASNQTKWEFGLSGILNDKITFVGEYGYGKLLPESVILNGTYQVEGNYFRIGAEYSFTLLPKYYLGLGGMFASSAFADQGTVDIYSEFWPDVNEEFKRENLTANWAEIILHSQGPIINAESGFMSNLYWGIRFRLRIMVTDLAQPAFDIYAVPGFGRTYSPVVPAANFFLRYRIKF